MNRNKLLVDLICDPRKINCDDYPKNYFDGTILKLVTKINGYYWNIFNKQRLVLIESLLKEGISPNQLGHNDVPLLFCSLNPYKFEGFEITNLLLKYNANPNICHNEKTILQYINPNHAEELLSLLSKHQIVIDPTIKTFNNSNNIFNKITKEQIDENYIFVDNYESNYVIVHFCKNEQPEILEEVETFSCFWCL